MNQIQNQLNTGAIDLYSPANRFASASQIYGRLHRWWLLVRRYRLLLGGISLAVIIPIYLYTAFTGPVYESRASMWVTGKINLSADWGYTEQLVDFLGTQAALLESPAIQRRALARLQGEFKPGSSSANISHNASAPIPFNVKVDQGAKSSTLDLKATGQDPVATRRFLDCLMMEYMNFKSESSVNASGQAASALNAEAAQLKGELAGAQAELQNFQASNNVVFLQQQGSSAQGYLAALNRQLATLRTELKLLDSLKPEQWAEADTIQRNAGSDQSSDASAAGQMLASLQQSQAAWFQAEQQMHLLMAQREQLSRFLRPEHPKIIKLDQDIAAQEELVQTSRDEAARQLALRRQALELQIQNLETASKDWNVKAVAASRKMADYDQIQQKITRLQAAYDKTFGLIQNLAVAQRVERPDVGILDPASVAKPTARMWLHLAFAVALSLVLCFGSLYVISLFQDNFASRTELAGHLAEPVLGQIPFISMDESAASLGIEGLEQQRFEFLEAFRNIRTSLLFMKNGAMNPKVMLIASSVPEEGKSTVALYLAATLAKADARVLLVDADLRRPGLHRHFGRPNGPGLAELLNLEASLSDVIFPAGRQNLALLPAGTARRNPGDLMLSPVWAQFLASARSQFDYILVDTPPVAATEDAAALAPKTDGVLFVVRALSTSARVARAALETLRQRQAHVVGLIFNRVVSSPCEPPYYQPYAHAYHWQAGRNVHDGMLSTEDSAPNPPAVHSDQPA
jgi:capsular exopolysaccharide synthesis family protein